MKLTRALPVSLRMPAALRSFSTAGGPSRLARLRQQLAEDVPRSAPPAPTRSPAPAQASERASPLTDRFMRLHRYLRVSVTERCNLRCTYCMPQQGITLTPAQELLTDDELLRLARIFVRNGVNKIRLTGGEPTVRRDLVQLAAQLRQLPGLDTLALTSNGVVLQRMLPDLLAAGISGVNISLDTLQPHKYAAATRRPGETFGAVWGAVQAALAMPFSSVKLNCVAMAGFNDDELVPFVALTQWLPLQVRFIELMPFAGNGFRADRCLTYADMTARIQAAHPDFTPMPAQGNQTAKLWHVPGWAGSVGFITTMTSAFCSSCDRLRLTADGNLKVCLHGKEEHSLRDVLRAGGSDEDIEAAIAAAVQRKHAALGGAQGVAGLAAQAAALAGGREMIRIGG